MSNEPLALTSRDVGDPYIVDAHMHLWHQRTDLAPRFGRPPVDYSIDDYKTACGRHPVNKVVLVRAALPPEEYEAETERIATVRMATGLPSAEIGYVAPGEDVATAIERAMNSGLLRGVRLLDSIDYRSEMGRKYLGTLSDAGLVYDLVCHPRSMAEAAAAARKFPSLQFVVEHAGWPEDASEFDCWRAGMLTLAHNENVACKISGLPMALDTAEPEELWPWIEACLDAFGSERTMFGSNMPVDSLVVPLGVLLERYIALVARAMGDLRLVFRGTAERVYRI